MALDQVIAVGSTHPILNNGVPGVYINGCSGFTEAGDELAATHLPPAVVTRVLDWAAGAEAAGTGLVAYVGDEALHTQPAFIERLAALGDSPPRAVAEIGTDGVYKMIVLCEDDAIAQRLRPKLEVLLDAGAELTQALPGYIEVVPTGASKATAAAALLDRWGLTWSDALAIGDGQNDVPMLREAGTSVAMANAKQSVRDAAQKFGCASNADDGWVEAMERCASRPSRSADDLVLDSADGALPLRRGAAQPLERRAREALRRVVRAQKAGASALVDVGGVVVEEEDAGGALQVRDRVALAQQLQHHRLPVLDRHAVLVVGPERRRRDDVGVREGAGRDEVHVGANDLAASKRSNGEGGAALLRRGDKGAEGVEVGDVVLPARPAPPRARRPRRTRGS